MTRENMIRHIALVSGITQSDATILFADANDKDVEKEFRKALKIERKILDAQFDETLVY